jgi:FixJ family two-component response regulator
VPTEPLIAVIDDDDSFRVALVESLHSLGYRARGFASAEEFLAVGGEGSSSCLITDIHMSGMSGIDLKQMLASRGCQLPVILVTARADPDLEAKAAACGVVCFLRKPFETETLLDCLEKVLNKQK